MRKKKVIKIFCMVLNFVVAMIKLVSGIVFNFSSLIADSLQSLFDFITDIISLIANKVGDRRANKRHPFGYGRVEDIANLFSGIILLGLALFILVRGFISESIQVRPIIFIILILTLFLKLLVVYVLKVSGKKYKDKSMLVSARESLIDLVAMVIVLMVCIMLLFEDKIILFKYADLIGSVIISTIIIYSAINIIKINVDYLIGVNEENEDIEISLDKIILEFKLIKNYKIKLIKMGDYYTLCLTLWLDDEVSLHELVLLESKLNKKIKNIIHDIKYIQIDFVEYEEE